MGTKLKESFLPRRRGRIKEGAKELTRKSREERDFTTKVLARQSRIQREEEIQSQRAQRSQILGRL
jgi:hypothetical protein